MICVLLSGGLDSTLALVRAVETGQSVAAVTYRYGQLHEREVDAARDVADLLDVEHHVFSLGDTLCVPDQPGGVGQVVLGRGVLEELLGHPPPPEHGLVRVGLTVGPRPLRR